jgi:hypothetical protein
MDGIQGAASTSHVTACGAKTGRHLALEPKLSSRNYLPFQDERWKRVVTRVSVCDLPTPMRYQLSPNRGRVTA